MLFVLPATPAIRPTSYPAPQPYGYYPSPDYYSYDDAPRFTAPSYPSHRSSFWHPSAEELEEREYRQALEVVANHRRRQAEKQAAIRRQQLAEAARQRYFAALAAEVEQQRHEELLAARRAEFIRSQQARARLAAAERQHAVDTFLRQLKGPQPVCNACCRCTCPRLIASPSQVTRHPHVAKRKPLADALKQRLSGETDSDITELIKTILPSLEPTPVESDKPKAANDDVAKLIENLLSSVFPGFAFRARNQPTSSTEDSQPSVSDKGKGKARTVDVEESQKPEPKSESADEAFANILRHVMGLSKSATVPRSSDEAGPSGSSSHRPSEPTVTEKEQSQIDRAVALSSVEQVMNTLNKLQAEFTLPTELDHYNPPTDDHDETASVSSVSSSDLTKLIPYTGTNKPVYKYENELNRLLEELDKIDSHGDTEVREKRKEVVKAVEKALEGVENVVGEVVGKRLSLISAVTATSEEPLKGFDVDDNSTEEAAPAQQLVDVQSQVDDAAAPEPSNPAPTQETVAIPAEVPSPVETTPLESDTVVVPEITTDPISVESDLETSTVTITPASIEVTSVTEREPVESQAQVDAPETVDTFLLPEKVSPPSPIQKPQRLDSDSDDEVLSLDSDAEKSDWSEVEH